MAHFILSIPRTDQGGIAREHVMGGDGHQTFGSEYLGMLEDRLNDPECSAFLEALPVSFHRVAVEDSEAAGFLNRITQWHNGEHNSYPHGRIDAVELDQQLYLSAKLGLPVQIGGSHHRHYLDQMQIGDAHRDGLCGSGVRVAVLDSGLDPQSMLNPVGFYDLTTSPPSQNTAVDIDGHGTAMAELVHEVAPCAEIFIVRLLTSQTLSTWDLAAGIVTAQARCNADIVNLSLGIASLQTCPLCNGRASTKSHIIQTLVTTRTPGGKHPLYVASTGNDASQASIRFPASLDECVAIGAVESTLHRSTYSNYGPQHSQYVLAPGGEKTPTGKVTEHVGIAGSPPQHTKIFGTSPATAYASGFLALLKSDSRLKALSNPQFLGELWKHHTEMPGHAAAKPLEYGQGLLKYKAHATSGFTP